MKASIRRFLVVAASLSLWLTLSHLAQAGEARYFDVRDAVAEGSAVTYFDLALQFAPGLARTPADGSELSRLPHIGGDEESTAIAAPTLSRVERLDVSVDGKPAMLLLFGLGQADGAAASVSVLALYEMAGKPRLLDAMDVGLDRETSFMEKGYLALSPAFGMVLVRNSHHNAGEEYLQSSLVGLWGGKLHDVDTIFSMSWATGEGSVEARPSFAATKGAVAVDAAFEIRTTRCAESCEPDVDYPVTSLRLSARYVWDDRKGTFVRPASAFDKIPLPDMQE